MAHGKGTSHHKLHGFVGWGLIFGLPFALFSAAKAIPGGTEGLMGWVSNPVGALGLLAFVTAALWYCKLEFDEVVMDYFDGGTRRFGLLANRLVALIVWISVAYAAITLSGLWG